MGKTQGVRMAARPAIKEKKKSAHKDECSSRPPASSGLISPVSCATVSATAEATTVSAGTKAAVSTAITAGASVFFPASGFPLTLNSKSTSSGGKQRLSSQHINSRKPLITKSLSVSTSIFCVKTALSAKYFTTISKFLSNSSLAFGSFTFPISLYSGPGSKVKDVGTGPSGGMSCE